MSTYEAKVKAYLRRDLEVTELRMKAKYISSALKKEFPEWEDEKSLRRFINDLDADPDGLVLIKDEGE